MNIKNAKGVTLIALTITIIVLLILAGVSITSGLASIKDSKKKRYLSEVNMVQNAVLQRYTKAELTHEDYPGQKITREGIRIDDVISDINSKKASDQGEITKKDTDESNYYLLTADNGGLDELEISNSESEFIVNYKTGEVINYTYLVTEDGTPLYVYSTKNSD